MLHKPTVILLFTLVMLVLFSFMTRAVGVRPLVLNFDLKPGDSAPFELVLKSGSVRETVGLSFYHPQQQLNGGLTYEKGDTELHQVLGWIQLEENKVTVPSEEEKTVSGEVKVPRNASGTHTAVIMIEQVEDEDSKSNKLFSYKVRYAVRLNINIDRPGQRARADLLEFDLKSDKKGRPQLMAHIKNDSPLHFSAAAEATLRDENRRLVERVVLNSEAAARAGRESTRIYPGSEIQFTGDVTEPLYPGTYNLQLFLRYANGRQLIERKTIDIEDEFIDRENLEYLIIEPDVINKNLRPGAAATEVIELENISDQPLTVEIKTAEIEPEYPNSIFTAGEFKFRGQEEYYLKPRDKERSVMIYRTERDLEAGGYYGKLELTVRDKSGQVLETNIVDLQMLIGEDIKQRAEILDMTYDLSQEDQLFSVTLKNTGSVHITPNGVLTLKDDKGDTIKNLSLQLQEDTARILPAKTGYLIGTGSIEDGNYSAEIAIKSGDRELDRTTIPVSIE